ncbi:hypothetical protein [Ereboglobus luteus]|uniref:Protein kinase domain-containing protein n=1 Tax=Ereboglobus luteus TaxID=1796921 RepID=A0A2U8E5B7_9BACT|nr:hypothetical protein [Ereboglobus luteus]AWI10053.1 hypothetical protein CKA38_13015 [Ereboglobus luteus]
MSGKTINGYTLGAEISSTASATVHFAATPEAPDKPQGLVFKTYATDQPPGPRRAALFNAFQSAIEAQQAAHAKAPGRWVAVRATGLIKAPPKIRGIDNPAVTAAYLVTDYYPRTLARIIDARLELDLRAIHAFTRGVIDALVALDAAAGRSHGALTAGNIFIGGNGPLRKSPILLTEPAPLSGVTPQQARVADNRALGTLIATLIRRRQHTGWPIEDGPEWTSLGKHKRAWLDFCNYLLDPHPAPEAATLDELQRRFAKLGGRGMRTRTKILIPVAALLVLASPFAALRFAPFEKIPESLQEFAIKLGNLPPDVEEVPPEFAQLCDIWYDWFGSLCAEAGNTRNAGRWGADPWLREHVLVHTTPEARAALDPRVLTDDNRNLENLRANPPESAKRGLVVRRVKQAHATLEKLAGSFVEWPGANTLAQTAERFEKLGLAAAAEELRAPEFISLPSINSGRLPANITRRLSTLETAADAERAWAATSQKLDTLDSTNDPVLKGLRTREIARTAAAPLAGIPAKLAETASALDARVAFVRVDWAGNIGRQRWLAESFVRNHTGPATDETLARWDSEIRDYYIVTPDEDPRRAPALDTAVTAADTALRNLANEEANLGSGTEVSAPLAREQTALAADLNTLRAEQVLKKDIPVAREKTTALQNRYTALAAQIAAALDELHPDPVEWLARMRAANVGPSAVLNAEWARRRETLLTDITADRLAANENAFRDLRTRVRQTREFLSGLDGPQVAGGVKPTDLAKTDPAITAQTNAADAAQKEELFTKLLAETQWTANGTPAQTLAEFAATTAVRGNTEALAAWREAATRLAHELQGLQSALNQGYAWNEKIGATDQTLGDNFARASTNVTASTVTAGGSPSKIFGECRLIQSLQNETNRATLAQTAASPASLSVPLSAWRRLDALPDWPASVEELDTESTLEKDLIEHIEKSPAFLIPPNDSSSDEKQKTEAYLAELKAKRLALITDAAPKRWCRGYAQIPVEHTPDVIARMDAFGVKPEDLTGLDRFDYLLAQAKQTRWARLTETDARDQRNTFVTNARAALSGSSDHSALRTPHSALDGFLTEAAGINLEPTGERTTPADIGPGRIGWTGEFSDDMRAATYRWTDLRGNEHIQKYLLVEPEAGVPFFLSTTAVSVGEFIALIEGRPEGRAVIDAMPAWIADVSGGIDTDFRPGPQPWRVLAPRRLTATRLNDSRMSLNTRWQAFLDPRWPEPYYAPGITPPAPPTPNAPMQNLPPAAARVFTERILGARLPTTEEWSGIVELFAGKLARPDAPGANFTDATWLAQRDHLVKNGALFEFPWPDSGAYAPPGSPPSTVQTHSTAPAYAPQQNDGMLWFADVNADAAQNETGFAHLFGNVATLLHDPLAAAGGSYSVAGGSAISPATIDPKKTYPLPAESEGYADIGIRPVFDASKSMIIRGQLMMLLRKQPYVRQSARSD